MIGVGVQHMSATSSAPGFKENMARQMLGAKPEESAEASLDALLKEHLERGAKAAPGTSPAPSVDPLDLFRQRLTGEYLDALEDVSRKYEPRDVVAFQEVRGRGGLEGELRSGGMLRLRTLTAAVLREFLCSQIVNLVKVVLREQRSGGQ